MLSNPKGMNLKLNFNAPHELSFDYYRHKSSDPIKQSFYDSIYDGMQTDRYLYLTDIGYFIISSVTDSDEDNIGKKSITCKSCEENELATAEGLYLEEGTYYLHTENNDGLIDLFLPKTAGWTIGYIDPSLLAKPYFVEDTEVDNGYNFLYTTIQDMFECIVEPDIIKRTISVYSRAYYAEHHLTDIHIAKYNLLKHKTVEENDEDKYTALNVQGKDGNLEIRAVNPTGKNIIYNFEPRYAWMSKRLQEAIEKWQEKCESVEEEYLTLQQGYYTEQALLFNKQKDKEVLELGLKQLQSTRDFITSGAADNYLENIKLYCTQYNSNVNGNVDYAKRPFISPEDMVLAGYPEFSNPDEEVATTYDCDYAFMNGSGSVLYTIKMTPIIEDRTVLSVEGLDAYYDAMASSCSTKEQLLAYDAAHSKLIINIANGDTPRDSEGLTTLDKTLMPIKNNHWATVKAFMKAAGLDMTNLSNVLNEIENRQTALSHVNSAIITKQSEINKATSDYNAHTSVVHTNYEEPIGQINKDCALDITAIDINGNSIFTTDLLNELMTHIKPTDYVDEYMLVTESMTYPQRFEKAKELMDRAQSQLIKISSGQKTYSIDTRSFLFNKQFKHFSEQLCAGAIIYVETKRDTMEQLHLTGVDINFDEKSTNFTLGNKYDRSDLKALYEDALGQNSKSFSELKYIAGIIEDQRKQLDYQRNWISDLRTLTLDNVLTSEDQAIEINNRGLIGRKRQLDKDGIWKTDENGNPLFDPEQVKLINNTLVFTNDNWQTVATAVGKIATGYNSDGTVKYGYGINGQVLIGELILGNNLVLSGTGAGIKIRDSSGKDAFYADENGNLVLKGCINAKTGNIGGWTIDCNFTELDGNYNGYYLSYNDDQIYLCPQGRGNGNTAIYVNGNFTVDTEGRMTAKAGEIAGYTINGQEMIGDNVGISGDSGKEYAFWAGMQDNKSPLFSVTHNGELNAKKGNLANITIEENRIYVNNGNNSSRQISYSKTFRANLAYSGKNITVSGIGSGWYNYVYKLPNGEIVNISSGNEIFIVTSVPPEQNGTYNNILKQHANSQCEFQVPKDGDYYAIINVKSENSTKNVYSKPKSFYFELSSSTGLYTTNAEISGTINATYGNFSGDVTIQGTPIRNFIKSSGYVYKVAGDSSSTFVGNILNGATIGSSKLTRFADYTDTNGGDGTAWSLNGTVNLGQSSFYQYDGGFIVVNPSGAYIAAKKEDSSIFASRLSCSRNGYIYMNGAWDASTPDISDERKKNSISPLELNYETLFDNLTPIKYKYNNGTSDRYHTGFIAQDVKKSLDVAHLSTQDFAGLTIQNPNTKDELWALRYGEFVALNTWQIQRCKKKITDLENTVAELKTQIQTLTAG